MALRLLVLVVLGVVGLFRFCLVFCCFMIVVLFSGCGVLVVVFYLCDYLLVLIVFVCCLFVLELCLAWWYVRLFFLVLYVWMFSIVIRLIDCCLLACCCLFLLNVLFLFVVMVVAWFLLLFCCFVFHCNYFDLFSFDVLVVLVVVY